MLNPDLPKNDPGLAITQQAIEHLRRSIENVSQPQKPIGMRIGVKKAGCSGYEYVIGFAYAENQKPFDYAFAFEDITVLVDKEIYLKFLKGGTTIDYRQDGLKSELHFDNPNVAHQCGCGESFTLVDE